MIILNTCNNVKIQYNDSEPCNVFSMMTLNKSDEPEMCLIDNTLVDRETANFLREFPFEWLESEDKGQIYGVRVNADAETCKAFLRERLSANREILLDDQ